jgi:hypothetical protein
LIPGLRFRSEEDVGVNWTLGRIFIRLPATINIGKRTEISELAYSQERENLKTYLPT